MSDQGTQSQISNHGRDAVQVRVKRCYITQNQYFTYPPATPTFSCLINLFLKNVVSFKSNMKTCMLSLDCCKGRKNGHIIYLIFLERTVIPSSTSHFLVITIFIPVIVAIILMVVNSRTLCLRKK